MNVFDILREKLETASNEMITGYYVRATDFRNKMLEIINQTEQEYNNRSMDDLVKALYCLSSQDGVGNCYMDRYNRDHFGKTERMNCGNGSPGICCPYYQSEHGVCFEDGTCSEWLRIAAERLSNNGWIPCNVKLPEAETEVLILSKRKYRDGTFRYISTTAMHEDGTVLENDSVWRWEDIEGEWNEEEDCYIIPEGWWEWKHYNGDSELNHAVDDEVLAWQPLPAPYKVVK